MFPARNKTKILEKKKTQLKKPRKNRDSWQRQINSHKVLT